jgi:hypothetical protein
MMSPRRKPTAQLCHPTKKVNKTVIPIENKKMMSLMDHLHWQSLLAKPFATVTRNTHYCTSLGNLGQHNIK